MSRNPTQMQLERAVEMQQGGRFQEVIQLCTPIVARDPGNIVAHRLIGVAHLRQGAGRLARQAFQRAARLAPESPDIMTELALACALDGDLPAAHESVDRALTLAPESQFALGAKAEFLLLESRNMEAYDLLRPVVERGDVEPSIAMTFAQMCPEVNRIDEGITLLQQQLRQFEMPTSVRVQALFRLGELLDKADRPDDAFAAWSRANAMHSQGHDPNAVTRAADRCIAGWSRQAIGEAATSGVESDLPVFIVGMPRSGTTLVEHIIDAHPDAAGGGERLAMFHVARKIEPDAGGWVMAPPGLNAKQLGSHAREVLEKLRRIAPKALRITDKLPLNIIRLGLIQMLFPNARVIHCTRDPLDIGLSCFTHTFGTPMQWSHDLTHIGRMIRDMDRLMAHWKTVLDLPILTVSYEQLVASPEPETRRIIDFLGLDWDDRCLQFHESGRIAMTASNQQVRKPIYRSSIRRHERYARHLEPLRAALNDAQAD